MADAYKTIFEYCLEINLISHPEYNADALRRKWRREFVEPMTRIWEQKMQADPYSDAITCYKDDNNIMAIIDRVHAHLQSMLYGEMGKYIGYARNRNDWFYIYVVDKPVSEMKGSNCNSATMAALALFNELRTYDGGRIFPDYIVGSQGIGHIWGTYMMNGTGKSRAGNMMVLEFTPDGSPMSQVKTPIAIDAETLLYFMKYGKNRPPIRAPIDCACAYISQQFMKITTPDDEEVAETLTHDLTLSLILKLDAYITKTNPELSANNRLMILGSITDVMITADVKSGFVMEILQRTLETAKNVKPGHYFIIASALKGMAICSTLIAKSSRFIQSEAMPSENKIAAAVSFITRFVRPLVDEFYRLAKDPQIIDSDKIFYEKALQRMMQNISDEVRGTTFYNEVVNDDEENVAKKQYCSRR